MSIRNRFCVWCLAGVLSLSLFEVAKSRAEPSSDIRRAAEHFEEGVRKFSDGQHGAAARAFLAADELSPNDRALVNAIIAARRAGDHRFVARAAQRALERTELESAALTMAREAFAEAAHHVSVVEATCTPKPCVILLDGEQVSAGVHYMLPGAHELVGRAPDGTRAVEQWSGVAGGSRRVTLRLIPEQTAVAVAAAGPTALPTGETRDRAAVQSERPNSLPNALFWAGGAGTVVLLGLTTWSGLEALSARDKLDSEPRAYDPNEVRQLAQRTDYFLVGTAILGVVTAAAGIWLVDWGPETRLALSPLPRGGAALAAEGHF